MDISPITQSFVTEFTNVFMQPNAFRSVLILIASMVAAYLLSKLLANAIIRVAQIVSTRSEAITDNTRNLRYRQIETFLSITVAVVRVVVVVVVGYLVWRVLSPTASSQMATGLAAISAGTIFVVIAGQTVGILLRDITAGSVMITEGWFHVGDYVKLESFAELSGVVERFTLRSTRLRALNGEIIWVNNQSISGVRVTPNGVRTIAVELFLTDKSKGAEFVQQVIDTIPRGKTMLPRPLKITQVEKWTKNTWHMTVVGQTPPGREWLIETYFVDELRAMDERRKKADRLLAHSPMVHMADSMADKRFKRAVRVASTPKNPDKMSTNA